MRRFSTVLATAMVLSSVHVFAGFDERYCEESTTMKLMPMRCVSCGIQDYYRSKGKEVVPSERLLATMAAAARSFRELNAGDTSRSGDSTVRHDIAAKNLQRVLISQIQAYGFCTQKSSIDWGYVKSFITNDRDRSQSDIAELAKYLGFAGFKEQTKIDNFKAVFEDSRHIGKSLAERRQVFLAATDDIPKRYASKKSASKLLKGNDEGWATSDCIDEMRETMNRSDLESGELCKAMVNSCDLNMEVCGAIDTRYQPPSGQTRQQAPSQPQPTGSGVRRLPAPPPVQ
ncbi:hypothetical protein [Bdellovibrio sp. HCB2-146]|uniref:hypothetical protein n=1 Tax=Bdellovibrio sp. HCB2-146 TaxID=3394362 RepID=UPI0039BD6159